MAAALAGMGAGNFLSSSLTLRNGIGQHLGRGALLAVCEDAGLYEIDLARARLEEDDRTIGRPVEEEGTRARVQQSLGHLAADLEACRLARHQRVAERFLETQLGFFHGQWPQPQAWENALRQSGLSERSWRCLVRQDLRTLAWIEDHIQANLAVRPEECADVYKTHPARYVLPLRFRARHLFWAAPPGSSTEWVEQKRAAAQAVLDRLGRGEKFADWVTASEDEASRKQGGDLNFFSEARIPADFWSGIQTLAPGGPPALVRTTLGFHIVEVTDRKPAGSISWAEARPEILARLQNEKRSARMGALAAELQARVLWNGTVPDRAGSSAP